LKESTICSFFSGPIIDIIPNPALEHANQLVYIARVFQNSPYGNLFSFDISTQKSEFVDHSTEHTCMTFGPDGDILMAGTKYGELMYYDLINQGNIPIRRPVPAELPETEGDSWWSNQILQSVLTVSGTRSTLDRYMESTSYIQSPQSPL
jgi:hypothetical protein